MRVVHISQYPLAGAPYHIVKCLKKYSSSIDAELVNGIVQYADGRSFPYYKTVKDDGTADIIAEADIVHIHNMLPPWLKPIIDKKRQKIVGHMHSFPKMYNWKELIDFSDKVVVIRQPFQVKEYERKYDTLPTLLDIFDMSPSNMRPNAKEPDSYVLLNYAPSNTKPSSYIDSKGYDKIMPVLKSMRFPKLKIDHYTGKPHLFDLERKSQAHVVIDDLTKQTYHLTGLFGLSFGCVSLSGIGENEFVRFFNDNFRDDEIDKSPFEHCTIANLVDVVKGLLDDRDYLAEKMAFSRLWMELHYNPRKLVKEYESLYFSTV